MVAVRRETDNETGTNDSVFDDADALIALAQRAFTKASKAAVAENDRLGIPTHGARDGRLVTRQPPQAKPRDPV